MAKISKTSRSSGAERTQSSNRLGRALEHVLAELSHASISVLGNEKYKRDLERVRQELARALVPADYMDVVQKVMDIRFPVALAEEAQKNDGGKNAHGRALVTSLLGLAEVSVAMGLDDTAEDFRHVAANVYVLAPSEIGTEVEQRVRKIEKGAEALKKMNSVLQSGLTEITDSLAVLAQANPGAHSRMTTLKEKLLATQEVTELDALRAALIDETTHLIKDIENKEEELARVRNNVSETATRARNLEMALLEAEEVARTDPLTTMGNRRALDEHVKNLAQSRIPVAILLIDIDHFKQINDGHGHETGDLVLKHIGTRITRALRGGDRAFRIGGDELVILLTNARQASATAVARRLNEVIGDRPVVCGDKKIPVTLSIGVTEWKSGEKYTDAQARADEALYRSKAQGRNQVSATK